MEKKINDFISLVFLSIVRKEIITYDAIYVEIASLSFVQELKLKESEIKAIAEHIHSIRIGFQQSL